MKATGRPLTDDEKRDIRLMYPDVPSKHIKTVERCENFVSTVFGEIERVHGEEVARKIFAPYGRRLTPRDKTLHEDAMLLWRYYQMPKRNAAALARALVEEGRKPTLEAALRWIKLLRNPREKRAHAAHRQLEYLRIKYEDWAMRDGDK